MKKSILGVVTLFSVMALAACGSGGGSNSSGSSANNGEK